MIRRLRWAILEDVNTETIIVLWMDDREEIYPRADTSVIDGVLHIRQYGEKTMKQTAIWHWSLSNIRGWYPEDQKTPFS
jgi:hypothetical protein